MTTCPAPNCALVRGHGVKHSADPQPGGDTWEDYRPTTQKAELHLTYACDLDCSCCNRASFLKKPHTAPMTIDHVRDFFDQADALGWKPYLTLVGGEPTLHPQFSEILGMCCDWASDTGVQVWSNQYSPKARELVKLSRRRGCAISRETAKLDGSRRGKRTEQDYWVDDIYISPADFGLTRDACFQHSSILCGIGVDSEGFSPCAMGGTMAAILGIDCRTKRLADLFDRDMVARMTRDMCAHCGHQWAARDDVHGHGIDVGAQPRRFDTPMSPTWEQAFRSRK